MLKVTKQFEIAMEIVSSSEMLVAPPFHYEFGVNLLYILTYFKGEPNGIRNSTSSCQRSRAV